MHKITNKQMLLLLIFAFSFIFRLLLMLWNTYPSGADIGLHNSIIYSIVGSRNTNFLYNFYQIGGGTSLTFPGYHIFTAAIIMLTGLPDYVAHAVVVSLFSSLIVLAAFLLTKKVWTESAAFIVAFLVAVSRFDIEMLMWGGYPNVVTLMLIPLTFYLFLERERFSVTPFLVSTSILIGSIFLTHSLSAGIFAVITILTTLLVLISPKLFGTSRKHVLYWVLPLIVGVILVSPFLASAIPTYLHENSSAPGVSGVEDINSATLSTRILPMVIVVPLIGLIPAFLVFSKKYYGRFLTLPTLLLVTSVFVPWILTQGYLFGFIIDYNRFLYFLLLPLMIFAGVFIDLGADFLARVTDNYQTFSQQLHRQTVKASNKVLSKLSPHLTRRNIYAGSALTFLLVSVAFVPIFVTPMEAQAVQSYYQVMNNEGYEAINWAKQNTPTDAVFVSDALYGWWFSGFALRPTLSAVDPQYLTLAREFNRTQFARALLDTDYLVDNGLVQVREDGGYLARHNPEILATLNWTYFPYSFFTFNSKDTQVFYEVNGTLQTKYLDELSVRSMQMQRTPQAVSVTVARGNDFINYTQITTVYGGSAFVNLTSTVDSSVLGVSLKWLRIDVESKGKEIQYDDNRTIALIDEGVKAFGQLIFRVNQPAQTMHLNRIELQYNLGGKSQAHVEVSASAYSVTDDLGFYVDAATISSYFKDIIAANLNAVQNPTPAPFKQVFDYQADMRTYGVSYIACRDVEMQPKFLGDPSFNLVFINSEVAIFKVKESLNQTG
ncbi:MAG: hypothetical protein NWE98_04815 [Candidatus Bathyarchaeota archaeon]|nr:hypothetical protein [Candidatus Bathyarchaeota archaeon]